MARTASIGQVGEAHVKNILAARGYEAIALQNASGHGIDIIAIKRKYGTTLMLAVEVKTTAGRRIPGLSTSQRPLGEWARNRLTRAVAGTGHYRSISSGDRARAQRFLNLVESEIPAAALVVGVENAGGRPVASIRAITRVPPPGRIPRRLTWRRFR